LGCFCCQPKDSEQRRSCERRHHVSSSIETRNDCKIRILFRVSFVERSQNKQTRRRQIVFTTMAASTTTIEELKARLDALERSRYETPPDVAVDEQMRRARLGVEEKEIYSAVWKFVPEPYYKWPLEKRAECLGAPLIHYLCKSLLMENRKAPVDDSDPTNPRFLLVVIQYAATLDVKKLTNTVRALRKDVKSRLDDTQFDFRIASTDDNRTITGFEHNSVTPFGILKPVPIVVSAALEPLRFFWMGGGHVHLKLGMSFTEFCRALNPIVADISRPRTTLELTQMQEDDC
jgi:prolyl-tRNA editing enzyme YbaK/EbsC (Cys-tRNA(Pro) deacylase)